ncbi:hypothetical protein CPT_Palo_038 [Rhizobium phage Palo]|uniref:Uncharacterized protein n=1 Tax=Rhizobium phage Palo TaxID=2767573 RepID=A0A7L8G4K3_9CAUD|nr:hypothetical protein CPT_Palo_038 [Rhizobium phage Palo]
MCDPITLIGLIGGAASLAGSLAAPKPAKAPKAVELPDTAAQAEAARTSGAIVRVGAGKDDQTTDQKTADKGAIPETRVFGRPVGGLGKSGLSI